MLLLLLLPSLCLGAWQGRAGYFRRLLDLPSLCPSLSLASPWSPSHPLDREREEGREVVLVTTDNFSLSLTGWLMPRVKEERNISQWEESYGGSRKGRRAAEACNSRYKTVHCGPVAVMYTVVRLAWGGGSLQVDGEGLAVEGEVVMGEEVRMAMGPWKMAVRRTVETFDIWSQRWTRSQEVGGREASGQGVGVRGQGVRVKETRARPWLSLLDLPLNTQVNTGKGQ